MNIDIHNTHKDPMVVFKVKDYTTELVGRVFEQEGEEKVFYVQRGDGTVYEYLQYRVEYYNYLTVSIDTKLDAMGL